MLSEVADVFILSPWSSYGEMAWCWNGKVPAFIVTDGGRTGTGIPGVTNFGTSTHFVEKFIYRLQSPPRFTNSELPDVIQRRSCVGTPMDMLTQNSLHGTLPMDMSFSACTKEQIYDPKDMRCINAV